MKRSASCATVAAAPSPPPVLFVPALSRSFLPFFHNSRVFWGGVSKHTEGRPPRDAWDCVVHAQHGPAPCAAVVRTEAGPRCIPTEGVTCAGSAHRPATGEPCRGRFVVFLAMAFLLFCVLTLVCTEKKNNANSLDAVMADLDSLAGLFRFSKSSFSLCFHGFHFFSHQVSHPRSLPLLLLLLLLRHVHLHLPLPLRPHLRL